MGITIPTPPISFKVNKDNKMEHIEQHHFVKKTETKAVNKHQPNEDVVESQSCDVETITFHNTQPTSSYNPYTFQTETSYTGLEEAIENGKDSDLVAMPVGEVRKMRERIRILEREVMKSHSNTSAKQNHNHMIMEAEQKRIKLEQQIREHERATDLKKIEIQKAMLNRNFKFK